MHCHRIPTLPKHVSGPQVGLRGCWLTLHKALKMVKAHFAAIRGESGEGVVARAIPCQLQHIRIAPVI